MKTPLPGTQNTTDKSLSWLMYALCLVTPIIRSSSVFDPEMVPQFLLGGICILLIAVVAIRNKKLALTKVQLLFFLLLIIYWLYLGYTTYLGQIPADALFEYAKITLFLCVMILFASINNITSLIKALVLAAVFLNVVILVPALYQLFELLNAADFTVPYHTYEITSLFAHRNMFAQMLVLTTPFCIYSALRIPKLNYAILPNIGLSFFFIILLFNRNSWIALGFSLLLPFIFYVVQWKRLPSMKPVRPFVIAVLSGILLAAITIYSKADMASVQKHTAGVINVDYGSSKDRIELWSRSIDIIKESPFFGHGLASWKLEVMKYSNTGLVSEDNVTFYQRPHNDYLWVLSEQGIVGLLLFLSILSFVFYSIVKFFRNKNEHAHSGFFLCLLAVVIAYLCLAVFSFPRERIAQNIYFYVSLGILFNLSQHQNKTKNFTYSTVLVYLPLLIIIPVLLFVGYYRFLGEKHTRLAIQERKFSHFRECINEIERADNRMYTMDATSTPLSWHKGLSLMYLKNYSKAEKVLQYAYKVNPYHVRLLNDLAGCKYRLEKFDDAESYYKKALSVAPNFQEAHVNLCVMYYKTNKLDLAFEELKTINIGGNSSVQNKKIFMAVMTKAIHQNRKTFSQNAYLNQLNNKQLFDFELFKKLIEKARNEQLNIEQTLRTYTNS